MKNLIFAFICLLLAVPCAAKIITVDANGSGDFETIQAAINDSNDGDIIILLPGTYTGDGNRDIDFGGRAITVRSTDPTDPNIVASTIIDCSGTESEPHRGFYFHNSEGPDSVLAGLTITNGYGPKENVFSAGMQSCGGAVFCVGSNPTIRQCKIEDNYAGYMGGGMYCKHSSPTVTDCTFSASSGGGGGGMIRSHFITS